MSLTSPTHPSRRRSRRGPRNFARLLFALAVVPLGLGGWGCYQGWRTLSWPTVEGVILGSEMRIVTSERRQSDGSTSTEQRATVDIKYTYQVDGRDHVSDGIQPYSYGMQNSALAREQAWRYPANAKVRVAYDPDDPAHAYLEPGASSVSKMLLGVGIAFALAGWWVRGLARRGVGPMAGRNDIAKREERR
jgi:hypothetical protein